MNKFIYVFSESDRDALLSHGYVLIREPKVKKAPVRMKKGAKDADTDVVAVPEKEERKYWVFANKTVKDMVFNSLGDYVLSDTLTF